MRHVRTRIRGVQPKSPQPVGVHTPQYQRLIAVGHTQASVSGDVIGHAALVSDLAEHVVVAHIAGFTDCSAVTRRARAQGFRHGREGDAEIADGAVGFLHRDIKVAVVVGGIEVADFKRTRRYRGFINIIAVLAHSDFSVGFGNATHRRRIAAD